MSNKQTSYCMVDIKSKDSFIGMCENGTNVISPKYSDNVKSTNDVIQCVNNTPSATSQPRWTMNITGDNYLRRD